ncbi:MAG: hypothetical protein ACXWUG_08040 [Polyangiales bacterium]
MTEEDVGRRAANQDARGGKVVDLADILSRSLKSTKGHAVARKGAAKGPQKAKPRKAAAHPRHRKAS